MIELQGELLDQQSEWYQAYQDFRQAALAVRNDFSTIEAAQHTRLLILTDSKFGRFGETHFLVKGYATRVEKGKVVAVSNDWYDAEAGVPQEWCIAGVSQTEIQIKIIMDPGSDKNNRPAQIRETLAHEWGVHGRKYWEFVQWMRTQASTTEEDLDTIAAKYRGQYGNGDRDHQELAEGTNQYFKEIMLKLKEARPDLANGLLQAWQEDIILQEKFARPNHLSQARWQ